MMPPLSVLLWFAALICFGLGALNVKGRINPTSLGLFLLTLWIIVR